MKKYFSVIIISLPLIISSCSGGTTVPVTIPSIPPPVIGSNNQQQTERLYGSWSYTYKIINTYTDLYKLSKLNASTATPGDYFLSGTDAYGGGVIAGYDSKYNNFSLYDPGTIIDQFYTFTFIGQNTVAGCYYLIDLSTNKMSSCYAMNGDRYSLSITSITVENSAQNLLSEAVRLDNSPPSDTNSSAYTLYLKLKAELR